MPDIIQLLSDHIANQIAAGEVVQRPASAVKELLENAIDAGATDIQLHLREAGKELIQVIDNGKGMSPADARMAFERHATSKIHNIDDLFRIRTMGFRGEALASVAAVAQVELRTRQTDAEIGTRIVIEGTEVKTQEPIATPIGTNIQIKNLFFNVPARRHFLKSNSTELRHIVDEFTRVAMAFPEIAFRMYHNGTEQFVLTSGSLKARIVGLLGNTFEKNLVPVEQETDLLTAKGFIGKPNAATKTRGNQFFFINNRFVKNAYLHHAVTSAYESMIDKDSFPFYVLYLEIDPSRVDVNVHPTKQEVKFDNDRILYAYLQSAVKHALARYNIAPSLDFSLDKGIQQLPSVQMPVTDKQVTQTKSNYLFQSFSKPGQAHRIASINELDKWKQSFQQLTPTVPEYLSGIQTDFSTPQQLQQNQQQEVLTDNTNQYVLTVQGALLVSTVKSGIMLIHMSRARERIFFERIEENWQTGNTPSQRLLFPVNIELPLADTVLLNEILPDMQRMGFDIAPFGTNTFVVQGLPSGMPTGNEQLLITEIMDQMKHEAGQPTDVRTMRLMIALAQRQARSKAVYASQEELRTLIDELFACSQPEFSPTGRKVFSVIPREDLDKWLF